MFIFYSFSIFYFILYTLYFTLYIVYFISYIFYFIFYNLHFILYIVYCILHIAYCILHIVYFTFYIYIVFWAFNTVSRLSSTLATLVGSSVVVSSLNEDPSVKNRTVMAAPRRLGPASRRGPAEVGWSPAAQWSL